VSWLWKEALRSGRPPTEAAYNIRIALTNTTNPVKADATQTLSNTAMVLSQRDPLTTAKVAVRYPTQGPKQANCDGNDCRVFPFWVCGSAAAATPTRPQLLPRGWGRLGDRIFRT